MTDRPFALIYAAFYEAQWPAVDAAIALLLARGVEFITEDDVRQTIAEQSRGEQQQQDRAAHHAHLTRVAETVVAAAGDTHSLDRKIQRCFGHPGITIAQEAEYNTFRVRYPHIGTHPDWDQ